MIWRHSWALFNSAGLFEILPNDNEWRKIKWGACFEKENCGPIEDQSSWLNLFKENQGFSYGFAIEYDLSLKLEEKAQSLYWGGYFNTRFFIDFKEIIVAIWMTQKLPNSSYEGYHQVLKKNVYDAIIDVE